MKRRVRQNIWGNTRGYEGTRKVKEFPLNASDEEIDEWLNGGGPMEKSEVDSKPISFGSGRTETAESREFNRERAEIINLRAWANEDLKNEIDTLLDVYEGSEDNPDYNELDALKDIMDRLEENGDAPNMLRHCRQLAIRFGWYREVSDEELNNTIVSSGRKYDFKLNGGKKYVYVRPEDRR